MNLDPDPRHVDEDPGSALWVAKQPGYLDPDPLVVEPEPTNELSKADGCATFALILGIGAIAGIALGGSVITSGGLWLALVASFALGQATR